MKINDLLRSGAPVVIKNINIVDPSCGQEEIINPGIEYGKDDKAKWSPPLQQELSIMKSAVGVTPNADTTELRPEKIEQEHDEIEQEPNNLVIDNPNHAELIKKLIAIFR